MNSVFFTDPHLGVSRAAGTTPASASALQKRLYLQAVNVSSSLYRGASSDDCYFCLGDVFDRFSNPEEVQLQGLDVVSACSLVLAGNHDVVNQAGKIGSLQLVSESIRMLSRAVDTPCVFAPFGEPYVYSKVLDDSTGLFAIPHVPNQPLFEQSLGLALDNAAAVRCRKKLLLLHCNYNLSQQFVTETSLNLLDEHVNELLEEFDYILMGHEHAPTEHRDGRLIVIGNTHPTGFADISDKRIAIWDGKAFRFETIWSEADGYAEHSCHDLPKSTSANFMKVTGKLGAASMVEVSRQISRMWERSPELFAVKMDISIPELAGPDGQQARHTLSQLPEIVRKELESQPELLKLWDRLVSEVGEGE